MRHTTVILGAGKTGQSIVDYLAHHKTHCILLDTREQPPELGAILTKYPTLDYRCGLFDEASLLSASQIIISPGVPLETPAIQAAIAAGIPIYSDIDLFLKNNDTPVIAITGSNGKTTVADWLGQVLTALGHRTIVCGNIGVPVLEIEHQKENDFIVMELSSFQLAASHALPTDVALCLNVSPDHLDRHGDLEAYKQAKLRIYQNTKHVIVNLDGSAGYDYNCDSQNKLSFSLTENKHADFSLSGDKLLHHNKPVHCIKEWLACGQTHCNNALAMLTLLDALSLDWRAALAIIPRLQAPPHRQQFIATIKGVHYINDSKATNIGSADCALRTVAAHKPQSVIWLAGGQSKSAPLADLKETVSDACRLGIFFGEDARVFEDIFADSCEAWRVNTLAEAIKLAAQQAQSGETVLLAPAAASLDQFQNFEKRGEAFIKAVEELE